MIKIFSSFEEASKSIPIGGLRLLIINGKKITLAHTDDGFYAFDNECPHQNEPLHKGTLTAFNDVVCRLHHYRFNIKTGQEHTFKKYTHDESYCWINEPGEDQ